VRAEADGLFVWVGTEREGNGRCGAVGDGEGELFEESNGLNELKTIGLSDEPLTD